MKYLIVLALLLQSCGNIMPDQRYTMVRKYVEPESVYYVTEISLSNGRVVGSSAPYIDGKDFIVVVAEGDLEFIVYTSETVYAKLLPGDAVLLNSTDDFSFTDDNNYKL